MTLLHPALPLGWTPFFGEAFYCHESNKEAFCALERWPQHVLGAEHPSSVGLYGPLGSGKTHLAMLWARRNQAWVGNLEGLPMLHTGGRYVFDDVDIGLEQGTLCEEMLLNFFQELSYHQACCLWVARRPPAEWCLTLPALRSRFRSMLAFSLKTPDDTLLDLVLHKSFQDIGIKLSARARMFLLRRIPRSFSGIAHIRTHVQRIMLRDQSPIRLDLLKKALMNSEKDFLHVE